MYAAIGNNRDGKKALLSVDQWRALGVQQSRGWVHYECHRVFQEAL